MTDRDTNPPFTGPDSAAAARIVPHGRKGNSYPSYRDALAEDIPGCTFVFLSGGIDLIRSRLHERQHRYMPASLLESQFAALEPPSEAIAVDVAETPARCVEIILAALPAGDRATKG